MTDYEWTEYPCEGLDNQELVQRVKIVADAIDGGLTVEVKPARGVIWLVPRFALSFAANPGWSIRIERPVKPSVVYWRKGGRDAFDGPAHARVSVDWNRAQAWQSTLGGDVIECDLVPREQGDE